MADNVTVLPGFVAPPGLAGPQPDIVDRLETLLQEAKDGLIISLAYTAVRQDHMIKTSWAGEGPRHLTGYGIAKLHHEFFTACLADD